MTKKSLAFRNSKLFIFCLFLFLGLISPPGKAQTLVVTKFSDRTGKHDLGAKARTAIADALKKKGAHLFDADQYLRAAKKNKIQANQALQPGGVKRIAPSLQIDGVVTGSAQMKKKKYSLTITLITANGNAVLQKVIPLKQPKYSQKAAEKLALSMIEALAGKSIAAAPEKPSAPNADVPEPPAEASEQSPPRVPETGSEPKTSETASSLDANMPPWARTDRGGSEAAPSDSKSSESDESPSKTPPASVRAEKTETRTGKHNPASPDLSLSAGISMNNRSGLSPMQTVALFPGIWVDGKIFLGTLLDKPVVRDIGIGGNFNTSLSLEYHQEGGPKWSSSQTEWSTELFYRLGFAETALSPTLLFRFGLGSTTCTIDADAGSVAKDVGYFYPYGGVSLLLAPKQLPIRANLGFGYLFTVTPSKDLSGSSGSGFNVQAGVSLVLVGSLQVGIGYDLLQFLIEGGGAKTSDTYQSFVVKAAWTWR
jgi:hypothetical protein